MNSSEHEVYLCVCICALFPAVRQKLWTARRSSELVGCHGSRLIKTSLASSRASTLPSEITAQRNSETHTHNDMEHALRKDPLAHINSVMQNSVRPQRQIQPNVTSGLSLVGKKGLCEMPKLMCHNEQIGKGYKLVVKCSISVFL